MRLPLLPGLLLSPLIASCAADGPDAPLAPPSFNFTNGPTTPGQSGIIRFGETNGFFIVDVARGLMAFHGLDVTLAEFCEGERNPDVWDWQLDLIPTGAAPWLMTLPDHHVWIYPASPPGCEFWASLPLIASGRTRLMRTDNDLFDAGPGANAFGYSATGVLEDAETGAPLRYLETWRVVTPPSGICCAELVASIKLH